MSESIQLVVSALNTLYQNPNSAAKEKANAWLSEFQQSDEAWIIAQMALTAPDAPFETKLFAAQTFRTKITYDLAKLPQEQRIPLRDSLLNALRQYATSGPKAILTQICIALADLGLQLTPEEWPNVPSAMISLFGQDPSMAPALLEFLQVLVEEYSNNYKIDINNDFAILSTRASRRGELTDSSQQLLNLITMYLNAPGVTPALLEQCFACIASWVRVGQVPPTAFKDTPIIDALFTGLSNDSLFDAAVEGLVSIIHETQELEDNMSAIELLLPRLVGLKSLLILPQNLDDEERMRGFCRVLVEAGEVWERLIIRHPASFTSLVEAIALCTRCDHLEVVGITSTFWWKLADDLRKTSKDPSFQPIFAVYGELINTIIRHLHYPEDDAALVGQERDDFRSFRHNIGDTLKDCCAVLGATVCLQRSFQIISQVLANSTSSNIPVKWQYIEAPLFSMRSMGAEVDPNDNEVLPRIMDMMPNLPEHPKIRYAATLVIGRYTEWINLHSSYIEFTLPYISAGLENPDVEVSAAAAQTLKYLCKDCSPHLVSYLPQLHTFITTLSRRLAHEDLLDISSAVAHIISAMPPTDIPQTLSTFCLPLLEIVHQTNQSTIAPTHKELQKSLDALERLDQYLTIVEIRHGLPPACSQTCEQAWVVLDAFLAKNSKDSFVAERVCILIRRGLQFFEDLAWGVSESVLTRMVNAFKENPTGSFLWITSRLIESFSGKGDERFLQLLLQAYQAETEVVFELFQSGKISEMPDVLDDFIRVFNSMVACLPAAVFASPAFGPSFQILIVATSVVNPNIISEALEAIRGIIGHDSLDNINPSTAPIVEAITSVVQANYGELVKALVNQITNGVYDDLVTQCLTLLRVLALYFRQPLAAAVPLVIQEISEKRVSTTEKNGFIQAFNAAIAAQNANKVKDAFASLLRICKRNRDRPKVSYQ